MKRFNQKGKRKLSLKSMETVWGFLFISPWLIGFVIFDVYPILGNFFYSFTEYSILKPPEWVGLANYERMFLGGDRLFYKSLYNTVYYIFFRIPGWILLGMFLAIMLNTKIFAVKIFRTAFYLPTIIPMVASSAIWMLLLNPQVGYLNYIFGKIGIFIPNWLHDPTWSKPAIIALAMWQVGQTMMVFLAGLQDIPITLYEAAIMDGANIFQKFIHVTLPMMTPTIYYIALTGVIAAFQVFGSAFIMTGGGPVNSTLFYVFHLYKNAFNFLRVGYASAMAVVLFLIILIITILIMKTSNRWVSYERI